MSILNSIGSFIGSIPKGVSSIVKFPVSMVQKHILNNGLGDYIDAYTGKANVDAQKEYNATTKQIAEENNMLQRLMWQEQRADTDRYFKETQAYNSADAQVNRLKDAGLNPALAMYQGVNAGTVSASSSPAPPVMQQPSIQPVDYSPMASAITNSLSLLSQLGPAFESLLGLRDASKRAKAETSRRVGEGTSAFIAGSVAKNTQKAAEKAIQASADAAATQAEIANQQLSVEKYNGMLAEFKANCLGVLSQKQNDSLRILFNQSFMAELEQKIADKRLTEANVKVATKEALIKEAEANKQAFVKGGYEDAIKAINSIDNNFFQAVARMLFTYFLDK